MKGRIKRILETFNGGRDSHENSISISVLGGWMQSKSGNNCKHYESNGEGEDVDEATENACLSVLQEVKARNSPKDAFNSDDFALSSKEA